MQRFLDPGEAAEVLGVSRRTVLRMIDDGRLPGAVRVSERKVRIPQAALEALTHPEDQADHHQPAEAPRPPIDAGSMLWSAVTQLSTAITAAGALTERLERVAEKLEATAERLDREG